MISLIDNKIVIASHNQGKVNEIKNILNPFSLKILTSKELNIDEPLEDGKTFKKNALIKSLFTAKQSGLVSLSDDSGICVNALDGQPGIHSARIAGKKKNFKIAMEKLYKKLKNHTDKSCKFVCALSLCWPDGSNFTVMGEINGNFVWPPRGDLGFGYDPIFLPNGFNKTFGEMNPSKKHSISHRQVAFGKLKNKFNFSKV